MSLTIETQRLRIAPIEKQYEDYYVYLECSLPYMKPLIQYIPMETTKRIILEGLESSTLEVYSIVSCRDVHFIGYLCTKQIDEGTELGINLMPDDRGKGYGPEAVVAFANSLHDEKRLSSLIVRIECDNQHSIHMFEKLGATFQKNMIEFPNVLDLPSRQYQLSLPIVKS